MAASRQSTDPQTSSPLQPRNVHHTLPPLPPRQTLDLNQTSTHASTSSRTYDSAMQARQEYFPEQNYYYEENNNMDENSNDQEYDQYAHYHVQHQRSNYSQMNYSEVEQPQYNYYNEPNNIPSDSPTNNFSREFNPSLQSSCNNLSVRNRIPLTTEQPSTPLSPLLNQSGDQTHQHNLCSDQPDNSYFAHREDSLQIQRQPELNVRPSRDNRSHQRHASFDSGMVSFES